MVIALAIEVCWKAGMNRVIAATENTVIATPMPPIRRMTVKVSVPNRHRTKVPMNSVPNRPRQNTMVHMSYGSRRTNRPPDDQAMVDRNTSTIPVKRWRAAWSSMSLGRPAGTLQRAGDAQGIAETVVALNDERKNGGTPARGPLAFQDRSPS